MNKIVNIFFVCLFAFALCSCAKMQNGNNSSENNLPANQSKELNGQGVKGGFHPGIFIGNRLSDAKAILNNLANPPAEEPENSEQASLDVQEEAILTEEKSAEPIAKGSIVPNSKVYIKAGEYKRKYALVEKEGKKK